MPPESSRARSLSETRDRILEVALHVLGDDPDAGMGDIASAAGVVRRTVYGHFPSRLDLITTLTERAVADMAAILTELNATDTQADALWVDFITRLWPVADRYRVLLALRRGEYGEAIHGLLGPVDDLLATLVKRGQDHAVFARHLPPELLSQLAYRIVFEIADDELTEGRQGARAATITTLLLLGVPEQRAIALTKGAGTSRTRKVTPAAGAGSGGRRGSR